MSLETERQQRQLAFVASGQALQVGDLEGLGISLPELKTTCHDSDYVVTSFNQGLTATVFKLKLAGQHWTLKLKRPESLVKNVDGETSFLNEVQRRCDFTRLKAASPERFTHVVDTQFASFLDGVILSPWIEGHPIDPVNEAMFSQLFQTLTNIELAGLFEWDLCPGNLLATPQGEVKLFDFGYMYEFDPLTQFNSNGLDTPLFHAIERFETRFFFGYLLKAQQHLTPSEIKQLFKMEKSCALVAYQNKYQQLQQLDADKLILDGLDKLVTSWQSALQSHVELDNLYLLESFRSNLLDALDDVHGKSCNPATICKVDYVLDMVKNHFPLLSQREGLFFGDEKLNQKQLIEKYQNLRSDSLRYQLALDLTVTNSP
ncbi:hypothetical protein [Vibrio sp.]|uniref:hypothetical protein n=1 Tax=Vibrio sp. TaxID=678 RepID=UPI003D09940C